MQMTAFLVLTLSPFLTHGAFGLSDPVQSLSPSATVASACTAPKSTPQAYDLGAIQRLPTLLVGRLDSRQAPAAPLPAPPAQPLPVAVTSSAIPATSILDSANPPPNLLAGLPVNAPVAPAAPVAPPAIPPAPPAAALLTPSTTPPAAIPVPTHGLSVFVTVQWLETWIDGTSRTWLPHTITLHQEALTGAAPPPGKGEIGMGTLTGKVGVTQTIIKGGATTTRPKWQAGAVAAMGMGMAGLL